MNPVQFSFNTQNHQDLNRISITKSVNQLSAFYMKTEHKLKGQIYEIMPPKRNYFS